MLNPKWAARMGLASAGMLLHNSKYLQSKKAVANSYANNRKDFGSFMALSKALVLFEAGQIYSVFQSAAGSCTHGCCSHLSHLGLGNKSQITEHTFHYC